MSVFPFRGGVPGPSSHRRRRHTTPGPDLGGGQLPPADFHQRTPSFPRGGEFLPPIYPGAKILLPLTAVLKGSRKGAELLDWSPETLAAFSSIKTALL